MIEQSAGSKVLKLRFLYSLYFPKLRSIFWNGSSYVTRSVPSKLPLCQLKVKSQVFRVTEKPQLFSCVHTCLFKYWSQCAGSIVALLETASSLVGEDIPPFEILLTSSGSLHQTHYLLFYSLEPCLPSCLSFCQGTEIVPWIPTTNEQDLFTCRVTLREASSWPSWNGSLLCYLTVVQPRRVNLRLVLKCHWLSQQAGLKCILCRPCLESLAVPSGARLCWPLWAQNVSEAALWVAAVCAGVWVITAFASWPIIEADEGEDICRIITFWSYFCMNSDYFYPFLC